MITALTLPLTTFDTKNYLKKRRFLLRFFCVLRDKGILTGNCGIPHLVIKIFDYETFGITKVLLGKASFWWDKTLSMVGRDTCPLFWSLTSFDSRKKLKQKGSSKNGFRTVREKNFDGKVIPLCMNHFDSKDSLKHRSVRLRMFSILWDNKLLTESSDNPSSLLL